MSTLFIEILEYRIFDELSDNFSDFLPGFIIYIPQSLIHIFQGIRENIKVTTPEDLESLRAIQYYEHYKQFAKEVLKYGL